MQSDTVLKGSIAFLALALVSIVIVRQFAGDDAEAFVETREEISAISDLPDNSAAEEQCKAAQDRYDKVMEMYMDRGSSDIMEQALVEAEEYVDANCGG